MSCVYRAGVRIMGSWRFGGPASRTPIVRSGCEERRAARTRPDVPPPRMRKS